MPGGRPLLELILRRPARGRRFPAYYPHVPELAAADLCNLHSSLMVIDDEMLRFGRGAARNG